MAKDLENTMINNNVHILTEINAETTHGLIAQLTQWMDDLDKKVGDLFYQEKQITPVAGSSLRIINVQKATDKIYSPYETIPDHIPVLNVYINSGGGKAYWMQSLLSMFHMTTALHGTIIRTYNIARACSCASMIAVSGTKGYRYMSEGAFNGIHFGSVKSEVNHSDEIELSKKRADDWKKSTMKIYMDNTKLTEKELKKYYNTEGSGTLYAKECLEKGICDWVSTYDKRFVNNVNDLIQKQR